MSNKFNFIENGLDKKTEPVEVKIKIKTDDIPAVIHGDEYVLPQQAATLMSSMYRTAVTNYDDDGSNFHIEHIDADGEYNTALQNVREAHTDPDNNLIFTPHSNDLHRQLDEAQIAIDESNRLVFSRGESGDVASYQYNNLGNLTSLYSSNSTDEQGGYLVPPEIAERIINRARAIGDIVINTAGQITEIARDNNPFTAFRQAMVTFNANAEIARDNNPFTAFRQAMVTFNANAEIAFRQAMVTANAEIAAIQSQKFAKGGIVNKSTTVKTNESNKYRFINQEKSKHYYQIRECLNCEKFKLVNSVFLCESCFIEYREELDKLKRVKENRKLRYVSQLC